MLLPINDCIEFERLLANGRYTEIRDYDSRFEIQMGFVQVKLKVIGKKGEDIISVLFDSGTSRSLIRSKYAKKLCKIRKLEIPRKLVLANGRKIDCEYACEVGIEIGGTIIGIEAFLIEDLPVPLLIGILDMEAYRIKLDTMRGRLDLSEFTGTLFALSA
jgi:hypothetical protein